MASPVAHKISLAGVFLNICRSLPGAVPLPNPCLPFQVIQIQDEAEQHWFSGELSGFLVNISYQGASSWIKQVF